MGESEWWLKMAERYGSKEAAREEMRRRAQKPRENYRGGFQALKESNPDKLKQISTLGGKTGGRGRAKTKD